MHCDIFTWQRQRPQYSHRVVQFTQQDNCVCVCVCVCFKDLNRTALFYNLKLLLGTKNCLTNLDTEFLKFENLATVFPTLSSVNKPLMRSFNWSSI
jgi:hypothetical protein